MESRLDYLQTRAQQPEVSLIILTTPLNFATKLNIYLSQINMTSSFIILMVRQKCFLNVWIAQQNSGHFKDHKYVKCIVGNDGGLPIFGICGLVWSQVFYPVDFLPVVVSI